MPELKLRDEHRVAVVAARERADHVARNRLAHVVGAIARLHCVADLDAHLERRAARDALGDGDAGVGHGGFLRAVHAAAERDDHFRRRGVQRCRRSSPRRRRSAGCRRAGCACRSRCGRAAAEIRTPPCPAPDCSRRRARACARRSPARRGPRRRGAAAPKARCRRSAAVRAARARGAACVPPETSRAPGSPAARRPRRAREGT